MDEKIPVDPLAYAANADQSVLEEISRLDDLRVSSLLNGFIRAVVEQKPAEVFAFTRDYFAPQPKSRFDVVGVAGPSRVRGGKGTIIQKVMEKFPHQVGFGCSHTTRGRREGEQDSAHYHFTSLESMRKAINRGELIEHAEVHGNLYRTSIGAVEEVTRRGQVCLLDIDIQKVKAIKACLLRPKYVFISPPSMEILEKRLRDRSTETEETLSTCLNNARAEMEYGNAEGNFDVVIRNDNLDRSLGELVSHLTACFPRIEGGKGRRDAETLEKKRTNEDLTRSTSSS